MSTLGHQQVRRQLRVEVVLVLFGCIGDGEFGRVWRVRDKAYELLVRGLIGQNVDNLDIVFFLMRARDAQPVPWLA